jgi:hypothetical protein
MWLPDYDETHLGSIGQGVYEPPPVLWRDNRKLKDTGEFPFGIFEHCTVRDLQASVVHYAFRWAHQANCPIV